MLNLQHRVPRGIHHGHPRVPDVLALLYQLRVVVVVPARVEVKVRDVVPQLREPAVGAIVAHAVRGAHVRREPADEVRDGDLVVRHLPPELRLADLRQLLVRPGVRPDLVARRDHAADYRRPGRRRVVDGAFSPVASHDEEGGRGVVVLKVKRQSVTQ